MPWGVARHQNPPQPPWIIDSNAEAWAKSVNATLGRSVLVSNLISGLKTDGVWSSLIRLWLLANETSTAALTDLVSLSVATAVNSPSFAADRGYTGDGSTSYIDTGYLAAAPYAQNSAAMMVSIRDNKVARNDCQIGTSDGVNSFGCNISVKYGDGNCYFALNDANGDTGRVAATNPSGIWVVNRTSSAGADAYQAGSLFASNGQASTAIPTHNYALCAAFGPSGSILEWCTDQLSMGGIAQGLTATQVANFTTRIQTYFTAIGA
jgi:hypothetical protein